MARSAATGVDVEYVWFDFHKECRKMRYDRLSHLLDGVSRTLGTIGYFERDKEGHAVRLQRGVVRTNCMDNLDRTNVVQSLFGRWFVVECMGLRSVSVLDSGSAEFESVFKAMWADNADVMSILYSGTGALKTDFTRCVMVWCGVVAADDSVFGPMVLFCGGDQNGKAYDSRRIARWGELRDGEEGVAGCM
jgi:hypothetical protein